MNFISLLLNRILSHPVAEDTRRQLYLARRRLPERYRTSNQFFGYQYAGCGATIGLMPRCDFACRGCYLGKEANKIPPEELGNVKVQLRQIRDWLGHGGNVQITDGEATLRPVAEIIEIIRYARKLGLVPMLMTHGDAFRKKPELLHRLMLEGGLTEVSIHIDSTQRGRYGPRYRFARNEDDLMLLRDEFADIIRHARRQTGCPLEAATTVTITQDNISQVPRVIHWLSRNVDAFKMISFQPVAQVGRTENGLSDSVSVDRLWQYIAQGLYGSTKYCEELLKHKGLFGHPDCTRFVQGLVCSLTDKDPEFLPLFRGDDRHDQAFLKKYFDCFGGVTFRLDTTTRMITRLLRIVIRQPRFMAIDVPAFILRKAQELGKGNPPTLLFGWLRGRTAFNYLNIVSHHFMNSAEIESPTGQERLESCVFKVPIDGEMISMCAVNALGFRERHYAGLDASAFNHEKKATISRHGGKSGKLLSTLN